MRFQSVPQPGVEHLARPFITNAELRDKDEEGLDLVLQLQPVDVELQRGEFEFEFEFHTFPWLGVEALTEQNLAHSAFGHHLVFHPSGETDAFTVGSVGAELRDLVAELAPIIRLSVDDDDADVFVLNDVSHGLSLRS